MSDDQKNRPGQPADDQKKVNQNEGTPEKEKVTPLRPPPTPRGTEDEQQDWKEDKEEEELHNDEDEDPHDEGTPGD